MFAALVLAALIALDAGGGSAADGRAGRARHELTTSTRTYQLLAVASPGGKLTSSALGIDCPGTCGAAVAAGTQVTLTAVPAAGENVAAWSGGGCSGTAATCRFAMGADTLVVVSFAPQSGPLQLAVWVGPGGKLTSSALGIDCPETCGAAVPAGTQVTLTAVPAAGENVAEWRAGVCSGTGTTCRFTMNANAAVGVYFAAGSSGPTVSTPPTTTTPVAPPAWETLSVTVSGPGTVTSPGLIACGRSEVLCEGVFEPGARVTLRAVPAPGARFTGWTGGCSGHAAACTIGISGDSGVTASFAPIRADSTVPIAIDKAAFVVNWNRSVGSGKLVLGGRIGKTSALSIQLRRAGGSKPLLGEKLSLPAGTFSLSFKLGPGVLADGRPLLPGGFVISVGGRSGSLVVPPQVKSVPLTPPPQGVVLRAYASASARGAPAVSIHATARQVFAHFVFQSLPGPKVPISIAWYAPGGKLIGIARKPRQVRVDSSVASGGSLPRGAWRVDLRAGSAVVKSLTVRVT